MVKGGEDDDEGVDVDEMGWRENEARRRQSEGKLLPCRGVAHGRRGLACTVR